MVDAISEALDNIDELKAAISTVEAAQEDSMAKLVDTLIEEYGL
jgi:hypothetical protein